LNTYCNTTSSITFTYTHYGDNPLTVPVESHSLTITGGSGLTDNNNGTAELDLSLSPGTYTITYEYTDDLTCINTVEKVIQILPKPTADFSGLNATYCGNSSDVTLTGNYSPEGQFTEDGIIDHGNGTATFQPSTLAVGAGYTITYTYTNSSGCSDSETKTVEILPLPTKYSVTGGGNRCELDAGLPIGLANSEDDIDYILYRNGNPVIPENKVSGSTGNPRSFGNISNAGTYTVLAENTLTGCTNQMSGNAVITVTPQAAITTQPANTTACEGGSATFTAEATGTDLTYQWVKEGVNVGVDNNVLTLNSLTLTDNGDDIYCEITSPCGGTLTTNVVTLTVDPKTKFTTHPANGTYCTGDAITLSNVAIGVNNTYRWEKDGAAVADIAGKISGSNSNNLNILDLTTADAGTYICFADGDCGIEVPSNPATLSVDAPIVITTQPTSKTACIGSDTFFQVTATGTNLSYQWQFDDGGGVFNPVGGNSSSITILDVDATKDGTYRCVISSLSGATETTIDVTLTIPATASITIPPAGKDVCEGNDVSFSVAATGDNLTYQWYLDGGAIAGATDLNYNITGAIQAHEGDYTVKVTGICGDDTSTPAATLTVYEPVVITTQPTSKTICPSSDATFSVVATGDIASYQWQEWNGAAFVNIPGADQPDYTTSTAGRYRCELASPATASCGVTHSNEVTLTVNAAPAITTHPAPTKDVCEGADVSFSVVASGAGLTYQWYKGDLANPVVGATSATYTILGATPAHSGTYFCVVSGTCIPTATSSTSVLTVDEAAVISVNPQSKEVCDGTNAELTVTASGTNRQYQWQELNGAVWDNIPGATNQLHTITGFGVGDVGSYRVIVSNGCATVTSQTATLTLANSLTITTEPSNVNVCEGGTATFTVAADQPDVTYQWQKNGVDIAGATSASLVLNNVAATDDGSTYSCIVSNGCGSETSAGATLTVSTPISITQQPQSETACVGEPLNIVTVATGTNATFQWYKDAALIAGATSPTFAIANFAAADAGTYYAIVQNGCNSIQTADAVITEGTITQITDPLPQPLCLGQDAVFEVTALGSNLEYEWRKNDIPLVGDARIVGVDNNILSIDNITLADRGTYNVVVTGTCGLSATSAGAYLDASIPPTITVGPEPRTVCSGSNPTFSVIASGDALTYQWQKDGANINPATNPSAATPTLGLTGVTDSDEGLYRCIITNACGPITSTSAELIVEDNVIINSQPISDTQCEGSSTSFTIDVDGPSDMVLQWYNDNGIITDDGRINGANLSTLTINNLVDTDASNYWCQITSSCGNTISDVGSLTVHERIAITQNPQSKTVCPGATLNLGVMTTGTVTGYQWQKWNGAIWDDIALATSQTLSISPFDPATDAGNYRCQVTNICETATSSPATITAGVATSASIVSALVTECEGDNATISVTSDGSNLTYQWYKAGTPLTDGGRIVGSNAANLTINSLLLSDAASYQCVVSGTCGLDNDNYSQLVVTEKVTIDIQPTSVSVLVGNNAQFTVVANGEVTGYQWYKGTTPLTDDAKYSGVNTSILTITDAQLADAGDYRCEVLGTCGNVDSNPATLTVLTSTFITTQPVTPIDICEGGGFTLSIVTSGSGHSYQWKRDGVDISNGGGVSGATTQNLTVSGALTSQTGAYTCTVNGVETSSASVVTVRPATLITSDPISATKCESDGHTFAVIATGHNLSYQWYKNDTGTPVGGNSNEYTINPIAPSDAGSYFCVVTGTCGDKTSNGATLNVNAATVVNDPDPIGVTTICQNGSTTLTYDVVGDGLSFLWKKDGQPITDANITGINTKTLQISNGVPANSGNYTCTVSSACSGDITSNVATVTVNPSTTISIHPTTQTKCEGDGVVFTVAATGSNLNYEWRRNGSAFGAPNSPTLSITGLVKATHEGTYTCYITGDCGSILSNSATLTINRNAAITTHPAPTTTICQNTTTNLTVAATGDGISYLWKRNGSEIPAGETHITGRTASTLTINNAKLADAGIYTVTITDLCGNATTSNNAIVNVDATTSIDVEPFSYTRCVGQEVTFVVEADGNGLTYQWKKGDATGTNLTDGVQGSGATVSGATTSQLRITGITTADASAYTCVVTGDCGTVNTVPAVLTVNSLAVITTQPASLTTLCTGESTEISVVATGNGLTYRWKKDNNYISDGGGITGTNSNKLVISNAATSHTGFYTCEVVGSCNTTESQVAEVKVNQSPTISLQPVSQTLCEGDNLQLIVNATGVTPLTYQWKRGTTNVGTNSNTLTINGITPADAGAYTVEVSGATCGTVVSNTANVSVNPKITIHDQPISIAVCEDNMASFSVNATGTEPLTYQWQYNESNLSDDGRINGSTASQLNIPLATNSDEGIYKVTIYSGCGNITSSSATLAVTDSTAITTQPLNQTLLVNDDAHFSVEATGAGLSYQWQKDGTDITGATSKTYSITGVQTTDAGVYRCVVTGTCGEIASDIAILTVNELAAITSAPLADQTVCVGESVTYSVTTSGTVTGYQWLFNGTPLSNGNGISGATTANLVIAPTALTNAGNYRCVVSGPNGQTVTTNTAKLTVNNNITINTNPLTQNLCYNDWIVLEVEATGSGLNYQWMKDQTPVDNTDIRISGITSSKLVISDITEADAGEYYCIVSNTCDTKESNVAIISINPEVEITSISADQDRCETQTATFSVTTNLSGLNYQWYKGSVALENVGNISGTKSANLTLSNLSVTDEGRYSCRVWDGCTSDFSSEINLTINTTTIITAEPQDMSLCEGGAAFFEVEATGTNLNYQWEKDGNPLVNAAGHISGSNDRVLVVSNVSPSDNGVYRCVISGGCNTETTSPATLTVNEYPDAAGSITGLATVCQGATSVHYTVPEITNATSYVWDVPYGATVVSGDGTNSILVDYSTDALSGAVTVYGVNGCGNGNMSPALGITVNPMPKAYAGIDQKECGPSVQLDANDIAGGQWSIVSGDAVIVTPTQYNTSVTNLQSGTNVLRWTVTQNGCSASDEVNITNLQVDVNAGTDQVICSTEATMHAITPLEGASWRVMPNQGQGTIVDPTSPTTTVTGLSQGVNVFAWQVNNEGCISSDQVAITNNRPLVPDAGPDEVIAFDEYTLQAKQPETGTSGMWELISGGGVFDDVYDPKTTIRNLMPGSNTILWTVTREECTLSDEVIIENIMLEPADAGVDQTLCVNFTKLGAKTPNVGEGEWTVISGGGVFENKNAPDTKVTNLAPGENILRWTVRTSLIGVTYDEVTIINNMPSMANAGPDRALCTNLVSLDANTAINGIGTWTRISGSAQIADANDPSTEVTSLSPGINEFKWTIDNNGCVSTDFVIISNDTPTEADAGEDQIVCTNSTELLPNTPTFGTGTWSIESGSGFFEGNIVSNLGPDDNVFVYTITNGKCKSIDKITVTNNKPTTPNAGYDIDICEDNVVLDANPALLGAGTWSRISGTGDIADVSNPKTEVTNLSYGMNIFRWTIEKEDCVEFDEVIVSNNYIEAFAGSNQTLCENSYELKASNPEPGIGTWSILDASSATFEDRNKPNSMVTNLSKGPNKFRWTVNNKGCVATSDVTITNNMPSTALAGEDQAVCAKEANLYANSPSYGEGVWTAMSGSAYFDDPKDPKTTIRNLVEGENVLRWTITEGNCSSYDDVIITRNLPEEVFAGNDQIVCSDEVTLAASPATIGTGRWEIVSGQGAGVFQDRYLHNTKVTSLGQGDNVFRWTVSSGDCHVSDEVTIRSSIPTTAFAGADQILCKNQTELGANSADTDVEEGFWQLISGSVEFDEPSSPTTTAINIRRGENIIAWVIDRDGCQSISELKLTNNSPSQPIINSVGSNNQVCSDSVTLYAQAPTIGTGFWSTPSNDAVIVNPEQNQTKVINLKFGTNTFRWTTTNLNCSLSSDIIVTSNLMYVNAGKDTTVNEPTIQLIGNVPSPGTGYWETIAANPDTQIETPDNFSTFVNNLGAGANVFRWNVDYKGCVASDEITVNYIVWPEVDFDASTLSGCPPLEIRFTNKTIGQGAPYIWTLGDGSAPVVQQQVSPLQYTYYETGTYVVTLTATAPGTDNTVSEEKTITVHPTPTASFEVAPEVVYIPGQTVSGYNYSKNIVKSIWDFGDGKDLIEAYAPTYEYSDTGKFNVMLKVINQFDCPDSLTLYDAVHVIKRSRFFFPDAFTPNPFGSSGGSYDPLDRSNDVFYPILADGEVLDYELKVFNRAGVMVFQSNDINIGWDGYYKDKLLPQGVYVYYITGKYNNGEPFKEVGNVLLIVKDY
jgi:hypothetical protein